MSLLRGMESTGANTVISGVVGGAASYLLMGRTDNVRVFGMQAPEALVDGALCAVGSMTGDIGGKYAMPWMEKQMNLPKAIQTGTALVVPATVSGGVVAMGKSYGTNAGNENSKEFMLGFGSKLVTDGITRYM